MSSHHSEQMSQRSQVSTLQLMATYGKFRELMQLLVIFGIFPTFDIFWQHLARGEWEILVTILFQKRLFADLFMFLVIIITTIHIITNIIIITIITGFGIFVGNRFYFWKGCLQIFICSSSSSSLSLQSTSSLISSSSPSSLALVFLLEINFISEKVVCRSFYVPRHHYHYH